MNRNEKKEYTRFIFAIAVIVVFPYLMPLLSSSLSRIVSITIIEWLTLVIYFAAVYFAGRYFKRKEHLLLTLFVWATSLLLISMGLIGSILPNIEQNCLGQWWHSFSPMPWTSSIGKLTADKELLLWAPGLVFCVYIGIISILGYDVSKRAKDILLTRISSDNYVKKVGEALNTIVKHSLKCKIDMVVASPLLRHNSDDEDKEYIRSFWEWALSTSKKKMGNLTILCLSDNSLLKHCEGLYDPDDCLIKYLNSKNICDKLKKAQATNRARLDIEILRRDNLPIVRMLVIRTASFSRGIFFMESLSEGKKEMETQGFQTADPAIIGVLSNIVKREFANKEAITRIGIDNAIERL